MTNVMETKDFYLEEFHRTAKNDPLAELRRRAIDRFAELGFPTGREEEWRFTDVTPLTETVFKPAHGTPNTAPLADIARGPLRQCQIAFIDGRFAPQFTSLARLPKGVTVAGLAALLSSDGRALGPHFARHARFEKHPFAALNTAFMHDGAVVMVPKGAEPPDPVHILHLASGGPFVSHPRNLIVAEEAAKLSIVESYIGPVGGPCFTNAVTEIVAGEGASIDWYKVQRESPQAYHFATVQAYQAGGSTFVSHSISLGAAIARNDIGSVLDGEGADCTLNGLFEAGGAQIVDHHTTIDHARPHGTSRELYKGILNGQARGVFDGRIVVRPDAAKTNAYQVNRNLLLSDKALVNTKPVLEIFNNDVKCKHGATIGQLDRDVLFYLRSRGIGFEEARRLLIHAFASEIVDQVRIDAVRQQLGGCLFMLLAPSAAEGLAPSAAEGVRA